MSGLIRQSVSRIEELSVKNYRALKDLQLKGLTPSTAFLGSNGSGKSTIFDVFAFLSECFSVGLRKAWDKRGRFKELRTRGAEGAIEVELKYREKPNSPIITYHLAIEEEKKGPYVAEEWLQWKRGRRDQPFRFLDFKDGSGWVVTGEMPDEQEHRVEEELASSEMIAVHTLGQLAKYPRVNALRRFITGWYVSFLTADYIYGIPAAGSQERLSGTGDNLPNVIQYLKEQHPDRLEEIVKTLTHWVPCLENVDTVRLANGGLQMQVKETPFDRPILASFISDGTLKMLAYLTVLYDPDPPQLVGIEEPENHLHPRLLPELAEECREASARTQLMVTTHSPFFVNGLKPEELWVLYRNREGYTQAVQTSKMKGIKDFMSQGALLGHLWMEGHFEAGDPLAASGGPK